MGWDGLATLGLVALFGGSMLLGALARRRLPEQHRTKETIEALQLGLSLLITFTALVLGLLTTSVKAIYDTDERDRVAYAGQLTQLDRCLGNYGTGTEALRAALRSYTAAVIASTWTDEARPSGVAYPDPAGMPQVGPTPVLAEIMNGIGLGIRRLDKTDRLHEGIAAECLDTFREVEKDRFAVTGDVYSSMSTPFFGAVVFWLALVFAGLGFRAPLNPAVLVVIGLCVISVTSALVIVLEMNTPYSGLLRIPSTPMRVALQGMQDSSPTAAPAGLPSVPPR